MGVKASTTNPQKEPDTPHKKNNTKKKKSSIIKGGARQRRLIVGKIKKDHDLRRKRINVRKNQRTHTSPESERERNSV